MLENKRVDVGVLRDALGDGLARSVAGPGLHPDENGVGAGVSGLQGGGELLRVHRHHPVVGPGGGDEGGRIGRAGADVMQG